MRSLPRRTGPFVEGYDGDLTANTFKVGVNFHF